MQNSAAQHITSQHSTAWHGTKQHNTAQQHYTAQRHSAKQHKTPQHSTKQHLTAQHSTAQHGTNSIAQHSTAQHNTAQHSTKQHKTAQNSTKQYKTVQNSIHSVISLFTCADLCKQIRPQQVLRHGYVAQRDGWKNGWESPLKVQCGWIARCFDLHCICSKAYITIKNSDSAHTTNQQNMEWGCHVVSCIP